MARKDLFHFLRRFDGPGQTYQIVWVAFTEGELLNQALGIIAAFEELNDTVSKLYMFDEDCNEFQAIINDLQ